MKTLKKIGLILLGLILVLAVIGFLLDSKLRVEATGETAGSPELVYEQVANFKNWDNWSSWHAMDTAMKKEYFGDPLSVGHGYSWTSENSQVGHGNMKIIEAETNKLVKSEMYLMGDTKPAISTFALEATEQGGTQISWSADFDLGNNPFGRIFGQLILPSMIKKDFEKGLSKLKEITEAQAAATAVKIDEITTEPMSYIYLSYEGPNDQPTIDSKMSAMFAELDAYVAANKATNAGPYFAHWHHWTDTLVRFDVCVPVDKALKGTKTIKFAQLNAMPAYKVEVLGDFGNTYEAHMAIDAYAQKKGVKTADPMEMYFTDPEKEPDTSKWVSWVVYPILP
jgi:hypothetical protein